MINIDHVSVSFGEKAVLEDISIALPDQGCVVFRGPSGCGKTTLLRVLAGLVVPTCGRVSGFSDRRIAMVFQEDRLLPWYTVKENIALVSDEKTADELLAAVGLAEAADQLPNVLSGGMRRRIAIARALAYSNDVLLLDEPFNGLDPELRMSIAALIRDRARLIVLVTHESSDAHMLGQTHTYSMFDGKIVPT